MPVQLPFVPEPNPDEILGSWLARVALLNGSGAWRALLEDIGYGAKIQSPLFDMPEYSPRFAALIAALGRDYEPAMLQLSTLPYWLTFDATDWETSRMPGMAHTPRFSGFRGTRRSSTRSLGIARSNGSARKPRYCPKCLEADVAEQGAAYWHRAHQLPNVLFCHRHNVPLRTACPRCGHTVVMVSSKLVRLPALRCSCGESLYATPSAGKHHAPYLMLARLSAEALSVGLPRWDRDQVRAHLRSVLQQRDHQGKGQYQAAIEAAFGTWRRVSQEGFEPTATRGIQHPELKLHYHFSAGQAPECCALMAALKLEFADIIPEFSRCSPQWRRGLAKGVPRSSWDVQRARDEILRRCAIRPGRPPSAHRMPYWFLRLNDPEWLLEAFPSVRAEPIPTVEADRTVIHRMASDRATSDQRRRAITTCPAGMRAACRDKAWFHDQLEALRSQGVQSVYKLRADSMLERSRTLKSALEAMLNSPQRPVRIFATSLGYAVGLSQSQVREVIRKFPELKAAIAAANADKHRRQVPWAAKLLHEQGQSLSLESILRQASLPTYARNFELARDAIAALQSAA